LSLDGLKAGFVAAAVLLFAAGGGVALAVVGATVDFSGVAGVGFAVVLLLTTIAGSVLGVCRTVNMGRFVVDAFCVVPAVPNDNEKCLLLITSRKDHIVHRCANDSHTLVIELSDRTIQKYYTGVPGIYDSDPF